MPQSSRPECERCGGTGKISYRTLGDIEPTPLTNGTTVQNMGGWATRACDCVKDLLAIDGAATWWETESIYSEVVVVPIGNEAIEISADCEVPRNAEGRRVHRVGENVYWPCLIDVEFPGPKATLHSDTAREIAASLIAAADACDARDELAARHRA